MISRHTRVLALALGLMAGTAAAQVPPSRAEIAAYLWHSARHLRTLQALLDAGANTQLADREGRTPLQLARERRYDAMVRALLAAGAQ